jgi:hypothetical protein
MSAYIVPAFHINALVSWAANRHGINVVSYWWAANRVKHRYELRNNEQRIASVLYAENVRSVNFRYSESTAASGFRFKNVMTHTLKAVDVIKACHGYIYQACEADDWKDTEAHAIINAIEKAAILSLPGYQDSSAWSLSEPAASGEAPRLTTIA